jgi:hypothetical protein
MTQPSLDHNDRLERQYRRLGRRDPACLAAVNRTHFAWSCITSQGRSMTMTSASFVGTAIGN